jgi:hypothetical protein
MHACEITSLSMPHIHFRTCEPLFMKHAMFTMETESILTPYFINPSISCVSITVISPIVARQRFGKTFPRQRIHETTALLKRVVFYAVHVISKNLVD